VPVAPEEFVRAGEKLFGKRWKAPLARALGIDVSQIWRYATGQTSPIPKPVELAVRYLLLQKRKTK
jgi:hypothetical protein